MLPVCSLLFPLMMLLCAAVGHSSPLQRRQQAPGVGSLQCNIDRTILLLGLQESTDSVNTLSIQLANVSFVPNVLVAQNSLHGAQSATDAIFIASIGNRAFDNDLINQFANNMSLAVNALKGIVTTDPTANSTLGQALNLVINTALEGDDMLRDCGHP